MRKIKSALYDEDTGTVDVKCADGHKFLILLHNIKEALTLTPIMKDRITWLAYNERETLSNLILSEGFQEYLMEYDKSQSEQESHMQTWFKQYYEPSKARELAREFMMYDS